MKAKAFVIHIRKITQRKPGGKNLFQEVECPSPTLTEPRLGLLRHRRDRCFMRHSAQCLTSPGCQLYNAVALFVVSLLHTKCHRSTHTRRSRRCVADKTGAMFTRLTREKGLSRSYPETQMSATHIFCNLMSIPSGCQEISSF